MFWNIVFFLNAIFFITNSIAFIVSGSGTNLVIAIFNLIAVVLFVISKVGGTTVGEKYSEDDEEEYGDEDYTEPLG